MNPFRLAVAVLLISVGVAQAQGPGGIAGARGGWFAVEQRADAQAYYLAVHHAGFAPQELQIVPRPTGFLVEARQAAEGRVLGFDAFSVNQFSQWVALPADADVARAQRRDEPGRILIVVPRRQGGLW